MILPHCYPTLKNPPSSHDLVNWVTHQSRSLFGCHLPERTELSPPQKNQCPQRELSAGDTGDPKRMEGALRIQCLQCWVLIKCNRTRRYYALTCQRSECSRVQRVFLSQTKLLTTKGGSQIATEKCNYGKAIKGRLLHTAQSHGSCSLAVLLLLFLTLFSFGKS